MTGERPIGEDDLQSYVDDRLPPERRPLVEAFLQADPGAAARVAAYRVQRDELRALLADRAAEPIPARLRVAGLVAERRRRRNRQLGRAAASVAWLALGAAGGWFANELGSAGPGAGSGPRPMAGEAIAAHRTFVVEVAHPVEVPVAQKAHLVQWLSKRLGRPLSAPDLSALGFRLMGGRLLPAGSAAAAQFMYDDDRGTRLTLYVRAGEGEETAFRFTREGDVRAFYWTDRGLGYVLSGMVERERLSAVARAVYEQLDSRPAGPVPSL